MKVGRSVGGREEGRFKSMHVLKMHVVNVEFINSRIHSQLFMEQHAWHCPRTGATSMDKMNILLS